MFYETILDDLIKDEKKGLIYDCSLHDKKLLHDLLREINNHCGCHLRYMAELDMLSIAGSSAIILKYIDRFESELFRSCLISQLVDEKTNDCDLLIMELYKHFRKSYEYQIKPNGSPRVELQIILSYDNAFRKLKSRALKEDFLKIFNNPLDVLYLPLTFKTICSWRMPKMLELIKKYINADNLTKVDFGITEDFDDEEEFLNFIKKQIKLNSLSCLQYYPTIENRMCVSKALRKLNKRIEKNNEKG